MTAQYHPSEEIRRRAELSRKEAEDLVERELRCPECGYKAGSVFSDCTGHLTVRCRKCKTVSVLNLAYFRRHRRRGGGKKDPPRRKRHLTTE